MTGVGEIGQIIGETGVGEMGVGEMGTNPTYIGSIEFDIQLVTALFNNTRTSLYLLSFYSSPDRVCVSLVLYRGSYTSDHFV